MDPVADMRTTKARREGMPFHSLIIIIITHAPMTAYKGKAGLKTDELRRRREEQQVEIRRQKREENISKRRNFLPASGADSDEESTGGSWDLPVISTFLFRLCMSTDVFLIF